MKSVASNVFLVFVLMAGVSNAGSQLASSDFKPLGGFGFDYYRPISAKCIKIDERLYKKFQSCQYAEETRVEGVVKYHKCSVNPEKGYLIYQGKDECKLQRDTMRANAP